MRKLAFSLIELLIVVLLIGFVSFMVVKLPSFKSTFKIEDLKDALSPDGYITVYKNSYVKSSVKVPFNCREVKRYDFANGMFNSENDGNITFSYRVKNSVGESFILECDGKWYVFKPFFIKRAKSFEDAKEMFLNEKYKDER